ncbi:hypothetical protein AGMMS50256_30180 [Betaproteobacteria bacterium]|nr:hypothetical protein AGMMS50256_30180 [Betaproteobacteria bacterium]
MSRFNSPRGQSERENGNFVSRPDTQGWSDARKGKWVGVCIPLAGVLMALGAVLLGHLKDIPLPEYTLAVLFSCADIAAVNGVLADAIRFAAEEARRRNKAPAQAAAGKQGLLFAGLVIAAALIDALYFRSIRTDHPYNTFLAGIVMIGMGAWGLWFMLTEHEVLWEAVREAIRQLEAGNVPAFLRGYRVLGLMRTIYWMYHSTVGRIFFIGVGFPFLILAGVYALWMNPFAVQERARSGEARWQYEAAEMYFHGLGLPRDTDKAFALYLAAARQDYGKAYYSVGHLYFRGEGTARDSAEAARWFRKAAAVGGLEGAAWAWNSLGMAYANGDGVERDPVAAVKCFRRAAEGENDDGRFNLGVAHESGFGLPVDEELALYWYEQAAAGGHPEARERAEALNARGVRPKNPGAEVSR